MGSIAYWWFHSTHTHPWSPTMLIQPKTHRFIKIDALLMVISKPIPSKFRPFNPAWVLTHNWVYQNWCSIGAYLQANSSNIGSWMSQRTILSRGFRVFWLPGPCWPCWPCWPIGGVPWCYATTFQDYKMDLRLRWSAPGCTWPSDASKKTLQILPEAVFKMWLW